jgi:hypothetical protein
VTRGCGAKLPTPRGTTSWAGRAAGPRQPAAQLVAQKLAGRHGRPRGGDRRQPPASPQTAGRAPLGAAEPNGGVTGAAAAAAGVSASSSAAELAVPGSVYLAAGGGAARLPSGRPHLLAQIQPLYSVIYY